MMIHHLTHSRKKNAFRRSNATFPLACLGGVLCTTIYIMCSEGLSSPLQTVNTLAAEIIHSIQNMGGFL